MTLPSAHRAAPCGESHNTARVHHTQPLYSPLHVAGRDDVGRWSFERTCSRRASHPQALLLMMTGACHDPAADFSFANGLRSGIFATIISPGSAETPPVGLLASYRAALIFSLTSSEAARYSAARNEHASYEPSPRAVQGWPARRAHFTACFGGFLHSTTATSAHTAVALSRVWDRPFPVQEVNGGRDRKSTRLNSSHIQKTRMPSSA